MAFIFFHVVITEILPSEILLVKMNREKALPGFPAGLFS